MTFILHGTAGSPFVRKALIALEEKGMPYEQRDLTPIPKTEELLAMNPLGKIPVAEHQGEFIPESSVICAYLEKIHPEPSLYPEDPAEYARALFLEKYADTELVGVVGNLFFERFVKPNFFKQETDEARVQELISEGLPRVFGFLEERLPENPSTLLSTFSVADVACAAQLAGLSIMGLDIDKDKFPRVAHYSQQVLSRPSVQAAMAHFQNAG